MIQVHCASCQGRFQTRDEHAGKTTKCPSCGQPVSIPQPGEADTGEIPLAEEIPLQTNRSAAQAQDSDAPPAFNSYPGARTGGHRATAGHSGKATSSMAIASMVTSLIGLVLPCIGWVPGLVGVGMGGWAIYTIRKPNSDVEGGALAIVGIVAGAIAMLWIAPLIMVAVAAANTGNAMATFQSVAMTPMTMQSMHQSFVSYGHDNNGYWPGLDSAGDYVDGTASGRFQMLVESGHLDAKALIMPWEKDVLIKWDQKNDDLKPGNFSFALLQFDDSRKTTGRKKEWQNNGSPDAIILSLRNVGTGNEDADARSPMQAQYGQRMWGAISSDGSAVEPAFQPQQSNNQQPYFQMQMPSDNPRFNTSYNGVVSRLDSLFLDGTGTEQGATMVGSNAYMVHD